MTLVEKHMSLFCRQLTMQKRWPSTWSMDIIKMVACVLQEIKGRPNIWAIECKINDVTHMEVGNGYSIKGLKLCTE